MSIWLLQCVTPPPCETWNLKDWAWTTVASVQPQLHWLQRTMGSEFTCTYFLWYNAVSCLLPFHIPGRYWWNSTWAKDWDWGFQTLLSEHLDLEFLYVRYFMTSPTCINTWVFESLQVFCELWNGKNEHFSNFSKLSIFHLLCFSTIWEIVFLLVVNHISE